MGGNIDEVKSHMVSVMSEFTKCKIPPLIPHEHLCLFWGKHWLPVLQSDVCTNRAADTAKNEQKKTPTISPTLYSKHMNISIKFEWVPCFTVY